MGSCNITLRARVTAKRKTLENMVNIRIKPVIYLFLKTDENQKKKQIKMHCWRLSLVCNCAQGERLGLPLATITLLATFFISCFLSNVCSGKLYYRGF